MQTRVHINILTEIFTDELQYGYLYAKKRLRRMSVRQSSQYRGLFLRVPYSVFGDFFILLYSRYVNRIIIKSKTVRAIRNMEWVKL